jgi:hypothetical protein
MLANIFIHRDRNAILPILRATSARGDGLLRYRKRRFQNGRSKHKRPPVWAQKRKEPTVNWAQGSAHSDLVAALQLAV